MATASTNLLRDDIDLDGVVRIPPEAHTFAGFRKWVWSEDLPENMRVTFIEGDVYLDMSKQALQSHVAAKTGVYGTLIPLTSDEDLGEFYTDGALISNETAQVSNNPDGVAALWETIESGRVRFLENRGTELEIEGTPDWVMEIVSDGSVAKDTKRLRKRYHAAGIPEYWLIDARGDELDFQILIWRKSGYASAANKDGWQMSRVFGRAFRLTRQRNRRCAWTYSLRVKTDE